jgi:hypothetical protein
MTSVGDLFDMPVGTSANEFHGKAPRPQFISNDPRLYDSDDDDEDPDNDDDPDLQPYDNIAARASEKLTELHGYFNDWDEFVETPDPALLPTATICVKRPSGETCLMDCRPYVTTVLDVKTFMLERGGHPILQQMLVHGGKVLEDNKSLCECEITKDHTIHLHLLCGSGPRPSSPTAGSAPQAKKRLLETNLEESGGAGERAEKRLKAGVDDYCYTDEGVYHGDYDYS